jgi:hypothetical protein
MAVPLRWRLPTALLPYAGLYAHTDGGFAEYRRRRTGFMTCVSGDDLEAAAGRLLDGREHSTMPEGGR